MNSSRQISSIPYGLSLLLNVFLNNSRNLARKLIDFIAYSNYFYGLCVLMASYETIYQLNLEISDINYYIFVFTATTLFYLYPYLRKSWNIDGNPRLKWYSEHRNLVSINLILLILATIISATIIAFRYAEQIINLSFYQILLLIIFPIIGASYYKSYLFLGKKNLRSIAWLKPFIIGLAWAGICNVYPIIFSDIINSTHSSISIVNVILFLKTMLYISILAIIFDIKDIAEDLDYNMITLVTKYGLDKTIKRIVVPLTLFSMMIFLPFAIIQQFSIERILLISLPFLSVLAISKVCNYNRSLLFYLLVIDGFIIYKAIIDIGACCL